MSKTPPQHRWLQIQTILDQVFDLPLGERAARLDALCDGDKVLRREVEGYLQFEDRADEFLERPLLDLIAGRSGENRHGEQLGPYCLQDPIAEGGMGTVYRALRTDGVFERQVAVKILRRGFDTGAIVRGFRRERQILAGFAHESIVRLIDGGVTEDGLPYLVMEDVEGTRLDDYCDGGGLGVEGRLALFCKLCEAVQAAHASLVVHCDLKPSNILVSDSGELKLLDFGIAKMLESEDRDATGTATGTMHLGLGTPPYASPEQHRGEPISTATDVYALGAILYRLLAQRPPLRADRRLEQDVPLRPSQGYREKVEIGRSDAGVDRRYHRQLTGDLDLIVQKATATQPSGRYRSAAELGDDVRRFLQHRPISARAEAPLYALQRFARRHRLAVSLTGLLLASILGGGVGLYLQLQETEAQRDRAVAMQGTLFEFLELADPSSGESPGEALRSALVKVEPAVQGLPENDRADALDRMGRFLYRHESFSEAHDLLTRALDLRRSEAEAEPRLLAASLNNLALVEIELGDSARAIEHMNEAMDLHRIHGIVSEVGLLDQWTTLALAIEGTDAAASEALFRRVLDGRKRLHGDHSSEVALALNNFGQSLVRRGDLTAALPLLEEAQSLQAQLLGPEHPTTLISLSNLAITYATHGQREKALEAARRVLALRLRDETQHHPSVARARNVLAFVLLQEGGEGSLVEAEEQLRQAIASYSARGEGKQEYLLIFERNLVATLLARGEVEAARSLLQDLLPRAVGHFQEGSWRLADLEGLEGEILLAAGDLEGAKRRIEPGLPVIVEATGEQSAYSRAARRRLNALRARLRA